MPTIQSKDGTTLAVYHYPCPSPRAQVVLVHGYGEHAQRYDEVAGAFVAARFDTITMDNRGHGHSTGPRGYIDSFSQYLDDVDALFVEGERLAPGATRFLLGHSLGGLISLNYVLDRQPKIAGLVLSSPLIRVKIAVPAWKAFAGQIASRVYPQLALPSGLSGAAVARDPEIAARYDVDPLNLKNATARWFTETLATQAHVFAEAARMTTPLLLIHGEADAAADPVASAELFPHIGSTDKTLEILAGAYHEIFNEPPADRKRNIARVITWLEEHLAA